MVDWNQRLEEAAVSVRMQQAAEHRLWIAFVRDNASALQNTCGLELAMMEAKGTPFPYGFEYNECQANSGSYTHRAV